MKARIWTEYCRDDEWGNEVMKAIADARFASDPSLDIVEVSEHAGWFLSYNREGMVVGTANDMAEFPDSVRNWRKQFTGGVHVGYCRRGSNFEHKNEDYYPTIARVA